MNAAPLVIRERPLDLALYQKMVSAIAECRVMVEAKGLHDRAEALRTYYRMAGDTESERRCAEIRIRAAHRAGQLLAEMKESGERANSAENLRKGPKFSEGTSGKTLADLGISKKQSATWQQLADISLTDLDKQLAENSESTLSIGALLRQHYGAQKVLLPRPLDKLPVSALEKLGNQVKPYSQILKHQTPEKEAARLNEVQAYEGDFLGSGLDVGAWGVRDGEVCRVELDDLSAEERAKVCESLRRISETIVKEFKKELVELEERQQRRRYQLELLQTVMQLRASTQGISLAEVLKRAGVSLAEVLQRAGLPKAEKFGSLICWNE